MVTNDFKDSKYYELFINNGNNYNIYWMSSRCINSDSYFATFCARIVNSNSVGGQGLSDSGSGEGKPSNHFRPIITLNNNVQIDTANSRD